MANESSPGNFHAKLNLALENATPTEFVGYGGALRIGNTFIDDGGGVVH